MSRVLSVQKGRGPQMFQAMIEIKTDTNAERAIIIERVTMQRLHCSFTNTENLLQLRVPTNYTTNNDLLVGIVDDDGTYNCKFVDGVQAQLIDANVLTMQR